MSYIYKTIMKRENHDFDICQNRVNSRQKIIIAIPKSRNESKMVGVIQNKTGKVVIMDTCGFKEKTIQELRNRLK